MYTYIYVYIYYMYVYIYICIHTYTHTEFVQLPFLGCTSCQISACFVCRCGPAVPQRRTPPATFCVAGSEVGLCQWAESS